MSIATEIARLQSAKTAIETAIGNKGVAVPTATKLDGLAALINVIEQSTIPYPITDLAAGSFTTTSPLGSYQVNMNFSTMPRGAICYAVDGEYMSGYVTVYIRKLQ